MRTERGSRVQAMIRSMRLRRINWAWLCEKQRVLLFSKTRSQHIQTIQQYLFS